MQQMPKRKLLDGSSDVASLRQLSLRTEEPIPQLDAFDFFPFPLRSIFHDSPSAQLCAALGVLDCVSPFGVRSGHPVVSCRRYEWESYFKAIKSRRFDRPIVCRFHRHVTLALVLPFDAVE